MYKQTHPLFDPEYYVQRYPDVAESGQDPLLHFLLIGGLEGRQPHPDFDSAFYLKTNPDVAASGLNPLVHFLWHGAAEGRLPHPHFDGDFYVMAYPDVAKDNLNPVLHFAEFGAAEHRSIRRFDLNPGIDHFLPVPTSTPHSRISVDTEVDVIIPVYKGVDETKDCLESILASSCKTPFRIVVVDDCSPEPRISDYLDALARSGRIVLIKNSENLGFVCSVNVGISYSQRDVILLNSDTRVCNDWIDRLAACAYAEQRTGTATPFSNNATICSYPIFCSDNALAENLSKLDLTFARVNSGRSVDLPSAVGFCMFIRRHCLDETGLFDAQAFGAGYGEENDFCMKSAAKGWQHKLASDVFVYHAGSVSFTEVPERQQVAMRVLVGRHPEYPKLVQRHMHTDPANAYRIAVTADRIKASGKRVFLSVRHHLGGGVLQHVHELEHLTSGQVIWLTLKPFRPDCLILECNCDGYQFSLRLNPASEYEHLIAVLRACGLERIHLHHVIGHVVDLQRLLDDLAVPLDYTVHDYFPLCPQVTLSTEDGGYCGEPDRAGCEDCLKQRPAVADLDIVSWRARHAWMFIRAQRILAPSADVAARISRYFPDAHVVAAEHPDARQYGLVSPKPLSEREPLRIVVMGTMATHKGFSLLRACAEESAARHMPLRFTLLGATEQALKSGSLEYSETGSYSQSELPGLLERLAPHLIWFPGQCAETYGYTLSTCLDVGLPVAVHEIGAFPERVGGRPWSWVTPSDWSAGDWLSFFSRVRQECFIPGTPPLPPPRSPRALPDFYPHQYLATEEFRRNSNGPPKAGAKKCLTIAAVLETDARSQVQACGYVRIILPLTHPCLSNAFRLFPMSARAAASAETDVILVQRTAIRDVDLAERIVRRCRQRDALLVFEIDDDLLHIPPEHPEYEHYVNAGKAAKMLAGAADAVVVSTDILRQRMLDLNPNTYLVPNYLDDRIWSGPSSGPQFAGPIRMVYAGTASHRLDLEFLEAAVRSLGLPRGKLEIDVVSTAYQSPQDGWCRVVPVPPVIAASYPRFVEWFRGQNRWHWGLAPLLNSHFNSAKSYLKILEYAALGIPSICSRGPVYDALADRESISISAENEMDVWRRALERAVTDADLWSGLRAQTQGIARKNMLGAKAELIRSTWMQLMSRRPLQEM